MDAEQKQEKEENKALIIMLNNILSTIIALTLGFLWLLGFVIAKGAWSTGFCIIPFYAWYLVVEKIAILNSWI